MKQFSAFALLVLIGSVPDALGAPIGPDPDAVYAGRYKLIFVGASLADNSAPPQDNGVNCLKPSASTVVASADVPPQARVVGAWLYLAGSLLGDDDDFIDPGTPDIFDTSGLTYPGDEIALNTLAVQATDRFVDFEPPGATAPIALEAPINDVVVTGFFQDDAYSGEQGNVAFFVARVDVTDVINNQGRGFVDGTYTVSGLTADVCNGLEVLCPASGLPPTDTCTITHTKGTASFGLLIIVQDPTLPVVSISVFQGLRDIIGPAVFPATPLTLHLSTGTAEISDPAAGTLAFFAMEGDLTKGLAAIRPPCNADEYIEVDGDENPSFGGLCLTDIDNPVGNIFNSTINTQVMSVDPDPGCSSMICCNDASNHVCGAAGVDIDTFDISPALVPGAREIRVQIDTGEDRIALGVVVLSVNVFEPVLGDDTQVRVPSAKVTETGNLIQVGAPFEYAIAISNTGNAPASNVTVFMDAPRYTRDFDITEFPVEAGAVNLSQVNLGTNGNGLVRIEGFSVQPGAVAEIRLRLSTTCVALGETLTTNAVFSFAEGETFEVEATPVIPAGPGLDDCVDTDPTGPFATVEYIERSLRGGGASSCTGGRRPPLALVLLFLLLPARRRWRAPFLLVSTAALFVTLLLGCGTRYQPPDPPPPPEDRSIQSLAGLPGEPCGTDSLMVTVRRANLTTFCIDRFEARLDGGALGNVHQGGNDDTVTAVDGSTTAKALAALGDEPATGLSWYQAKAACLNAGKWLCARTDWERACRGPADYAYPYGDDYDDHTCNGYFNFADDKPSVTGSLATCGNLVFGAYDMSGNVAEWVDEPVPRVPSETEEKDRVVRGGSYRSNRSGLTCYGAEFHEPPGATAADLGFRCCSAAP